MTRHEWHVLAPLKDKHWGGRTVSDRRAVTLYGVFNTPSRKSSWRYSFKNLTHNQRDILKQSSTLWRVKLISSKLLAEQNMLTETMFTADCTASVIDITWFSVRPVEDGCEKLWHFTMPLTSDSANRRFRNSSYILKEKNYSKILNFGGLFWSVLPVKQNVFKADYIAPFSPIHSHETSPGWICEAVTFDVVLNIRFRKPSFSRLILQFWHKNQRDI